MVSFFGKTRIGQYFYMDVVNFVIDRKQTVTHSGIQLTFSVPNKLNVHRADSFSSKEPETLKWIDQIRADEVLWDIGANVGLYACYAAKKTGCKVFAFEPSVFNIELLARNIFNNNVMDRVTIIPLPLFESVSENSLNMTSTNWGGALSSFAETYGQDGREMHKIFEFKTVGLSMEDATTLLEVKAPDYIKMDVDGIEHLILKGGTAILRGVKGVLIEIDESFEKQFSDSNQFLKEAGLVMIEKFNADKSGDPTFANCYNQVWVRK